MLKEAMFMVIQTIGLLRGGDPVLREDAFCLAQNIYYEARSASVQDQIRVSGFTIEHAHQRGITICEEVYSTPHTKSTTQKYSWASKPRNISLDIFRNKKEYQAWKDAVEVAVLMLSGDSLGYDVSGADMFYSPDALKRLYGVGKPSWHTKDFVVLASTKDFVFGKVVTNVGGV